MIPIPILIPHSEGAEITLPTWLSVITITSLAIAIAGAVLLITTVMLDVVFDIDKDWLFRLSVAILLIGCALTLICILFMLIFGQ